MSDSRQLALNALRQIHQQDAYADVAVDRCLSRSSLAERDRRLFTELVYGIVRRQRTLDGAIDQLAKKPAAQQPPDLRLILQIGLYQLLFLDHIPASAAIHTTVELAKKNRFAGLSGFVNGLLRQCDRQLVQAKDAGKDPIEALLPVQSSEVTRLGMRHSYPDWIVQQWLEQFGQEETQQLCNWMNQPPHLDIRVNTLRSNREDVIKALAEIGVTATPIDSLPQGLRLSHSPGSVKTLPGFESGEWIVQDASAQLVSYLVDPQPGEVIVDACAAPGGKTLHLAELMGDRGTVYACDRTASRLKKLQQNLDRLGLKSVHIIEGDSRSLPQFVNQCDRVLVDAPCSGLGTLHRHADARWRQTPESVAGLAQLQQEILTHAATWVKPGGVLIYSTCTLHPIENEQTIAAFLQAHPQWQIEPPAQSFPARSLVSESGWIRVLPHQHNMDGFFMVRLRKAEEISAGET